MKKNKKRNLIAKIKIWKNKVEEELKESLGVSHNVLEEAMHYSVFGEAKRFRAICLISSFYANFKNKSALKKEILQVATAIELIHTYSLVHDDLPWCDASDYRRGKLACHKKFSPTIALLTGNSLFTLAFFLLASIKNYHLSTKLIRELAESIGHKGMLLGQTLDLTLNSSEINESSLEYVHLNKTAKLMATSLRLGAILASASPKKIKVMTEFGLNLGKAFQIIDDLADKDEKGVSCLKVNPSISYWKKKVEALLERCEELIRHHYSPEKGAYLYYPLDVLREVKISQ